MKPWHHGFKLDEEAPTEALVWVRLLNLPFEFWYEEVFEAIGNSIGVYMGTSDYTQELRTVSYARICVHMDLEAPLPAKITVHLLDEDIEWEQSLDCENLPFCCRVCSEYGHMAKGCPHAVPDMPANEPQTDGFIQPKCKTRTGKNMNPSPQHTSNNRFQPLQNSEEKELCPDTT